MATPTSKVAYAAYPSVKLKGMKPDKKNGGEKFGILKELLFGDWISIPLKNGQYIKSKFIEGKKEVSYIKVHARGTDGFL